MIYKFYYLGYALASTEIKVPRIRATFSGVPIVRTIVYSGSMLGSPYFREKNRGKANALKSYTWQPSNQSGSLAARNGP